MKKSRIFNRIMLFVSALFVSLGIFACAPRQYATVVGSREVIGCGGYGAIFHSRINPFNDDYFAATCDMGSLFFSYDRGQNWTRHNIPGTFYALEYDQSVEGVVWAAGSGVYKSTDHGRTMKLVFPKESDLTSFGNNYENANRWLYTDNKSDYAPQYQIWSIAINRKSEGKNVFVAQRVPSSGFGYNRCIRIYSTDDGENFSLFTELEYSYNYKIDYDESNDCLIYITPDKIVEVDKNGEIACVIDQPVLVQFSRGNNISFSGYYDKNSNKNTFLFSAPSNDEHVECACFITQNLRDKSTYEDLTAQLCELTTDDFGVENVAEYNSGRPSYEYCEWINGKTVPQRFKWTITDVAIANSDVCYLFHESRTDTYDSDGKFYINRRAMIYLRYDKTKPAGERFFWVYGMPLKPYDKTITNVSWQDSDTDYSLGMDSTASNPYSLLYCSNTGIFYSADGRDVKQLYCNVLSKDEFTLDDGKGHTVPREIRRVETTGMDVICTHKVATDPFNSEHLLMCCTDIGLLQSYDGGKSWYHGLLEWQNGEIKNINYAPYTNTCFDVHFDSEREGVVYGIWSRIKTAPTTADSSHLTSASRFGVSYDGGLSWTMSNITPDGCCLPYRMQVVYIGDEREIYVTTDSHGFFVTKDEGKTFKSLNAGITVAECDGYTAIWGNKLLVCGMGTFAAVSGAATDTTSHMLYKLNESTGKFEEIGLPETEPDKNGKTYTPAAIRDMIYDEKEDCLYIACTAVSAKNYSQLVCRAGGIWKYKGGVFTQVYDDSRHISALKLDGSGRLYATERCGKLLRFYNNNTECETLVDDLFHVIKGFDFGATDDIIYISTWGGGVEKLVLERV